MVMMIDAQTLIQALSDPIRLRTLVLLSQEGALCVCELTAALNVSQPKMSRHLAALRTCDAVEDHRVANRVYYRIHAGLPRWAQGVIENLAEPVVASTEFKAIAARLKVARERPPPEVAARPAMAILSHGSSWTSQF